MQIPAAGSSSAQVKAAIASLVMFSFHFLNGMLKYFVKSSRMLRLLSDVEPSQTRGDGMDGSPEMMRQCSAGPNRGVPPDGKRLLFFAYLLA